MSEYTPGPWTFHDEYTDSGGLYQVLRGESYQDVIGENGAMTTANARLIAAAPDLLAALEALVEIDTRTRERLKGVSMPVTDALFATARAAIAKAKATP